MTLGQAVSNFVSGALVAGWVGLRAYEAYQAYSQQEEDAEGEQQQQHAAAQRQRRNVQAGGPVIFTYTLGEGGRIIYGMPGDELDGDDDEEGLHGGRADNPLGIDLLNLQLGLIDRDFTEADYEMLLALDQDDMGRGQPISEEQLAALPEHAWRAAQQQAPSSGATANSTGAARHSNSSGSKAADVDAPSCSICLDDFREGAQVSALPCLHQFHAGCVQPWLRQQGSASTCPICKTPVFQH